MSKAFDRVWYDSLIDKIKCIGINGMLLKLIKSFLGNNFQRVVLNGQTSSWEPLRAGMPQDSVLGPLLFLIYINDLLKNLSVNTKLFADDTSIFSILKNISLSTNQLNSHLEKNSNWTYQWKM